MGEIIVETQLGKLRGLIQSGVGNQTFSAFKGIPFAKPPIGPLRFRDPEPAEPWSGVLDAIAYSSDCAQFDHLTQKLVGSDDCLYLNIFTNDLKFRVGRPVIFWIYAGTFIFGNGTDFAYGPDYFMRKDVILITFNYRLGVLDQISESDNRSSTRVRTIGFLNLDDEFATGNQGLKDQVMALQWVRDNIANFGGDPNNITIAGSSAGSISAHYLTISPLAKGLFHKAIFQSGVSLNPWAYLISDPKEGAYQLCKQLGCQEKDPKLIVEFLRSVNAQKLAITLEEIERNSGDRIRYLHLFGPTIDSKSKKPFMPVHPEIMVAEGVQVPLIIGQTNREGLYHRRDLTKTIDLFNKELDSVLHPGLVATLKKLYNLTPEDLKRIYFKNNLITADNLENLLDLFGDVYYIEGIHRVLKIQVEKSRSPTYFYQFSYDKKLVSAKRPTGRKITGAGHARELPYMFKMKYFSDILGNIEKDLENCRITDQMIEMCVNFATIGNPTPETSDLIPVYWEPVNNNTVFNYLVFNYLDINEQLRMKTMLSWEQRYAQKN